MHLTNVKLNKGYARDGGQELFDDGKWSLSQLWSYIRAQNLGDPVRLWRQIRILAALALLAAEPKMSSQVCILWPDSICEPSNDLVWTLYSYAVTDIVQ